MYRNCRHTFRSEDLTWNRERARETKPWKRPEGVKGSAAQARTQASKDHRPDLSRGFKTTPTKGSVWRSTHASVPTPLTRARPPTHPLAGTLARIGCLSKGLLAILRRETAG